MFSASIEFITAQHSTAQHSVTAQCLRSLRDLEPSLFLILILSLNRIKRIKLYFSWLKTSRLQLPERRNGSPGSGPRSLTETERGNGMGYQKDDSDCALCGAKRSTFNTTQGNCQLRVYDTSYPLALAILTRLYAVLFSPLLYCPTIRYVLDIPFQYHLFSLFYLL